MQCNIDSQGRKLRYLSGAVCTVGGVLLLGYAANGVGGHPWAAWAGVAVLGSGLFQIGEAKAGWCALRAMGIKTPR